MFDPTIFDNLKVVLEGAVYDHDLNEEIIVVNRKDLIDLATMSRSYHIEFQMNDEKKRFETAEMILFASMKDLAMEMIHENAKDAGCIVEINFYTNSTHCEQIERDLLQIWGNRPMITQEISYIFGHEEKKNRVNISFGRKINERQIDDLKNIVEYTIKSLKALKRSV